MGEVPATGEGLAGWVGEAVTAGKGLEDKAVIIVLVGILEEVLVILSLPGTNVPGVLLDTVLSISLGTVESIPELVLVGFRIVVVALCVV